MAGGVQNVKFKFFKAQDSDSGTKGLQGRAGLVGGEVNHWFVAGPHYQEYDEGQKDPMFQAKNLTTQ